MITLKQQLGHGIGSTTGVVRTRRLGSIRIAGGRSSGSVAAGILAMGTLLFVTAVAVAQDELPKWPTYTLQFDVVSEPLVLDQYPARPGQPWPKYAATLRISKNGSLGCYEYATEAERAKCRSEALLATEAAKKLSAEQKHFVQSAIWYATPEMPREDRRDKVLMNTKLLTVYAISETDARQMAYAVLGLTNSRERKRFQQSVESLANTRAALPQLQKQLKDAEDLCKKRMQTLTKLRKAVTYETQEEARDDVLRLRIALRSVNVHIAGLNAKIDAIQELRNRRGNNDEHAVLLELDRIQIQQDVELAGALKEKSVLEEHLKNAETFLQVSKAYNDDASDLRRIQANIKKTTETLHNFELYPPRARTTKLTRTIGMVKIQPVKFPK